MVLDKVLLIDSSEINLDETKYKNPVYFKYNYVCLK